MSREPAPGERKPDTGPLPSLPESSSGERKPDTGPLPSLPQASPFARFPLAAYWRWAVGAAVALLAVGALLFFTRPPDPMTDQRPVEVVKGFVAAVEAKDLTKMLSYAEPTVYRRENGAEVRAYMEYIEEIHFENPSYELLDNDGERAHVRWKATVRYRLNIGEIKSGEKPFETMVELTKIEGNWYLRDLTLPQT